MISGRSSYAGDLFLPPATGGGLAVCVCVSVCISPFVQMGKKLYLVGPHLSSLHFYHSGFSVFQFYLHLLPYCLACSYIQKSAAKEMFPHNHLFTVLIHSPPLVMDSFLLPKNYVNVFIAS